MEMSVAREIDQAKLKEVRIRFRRQRIASDVEKWERIVLPFNLEKEPWSFPTEAKARVTSQTPGGRMSRFRWTTSHFHLRQ